MPIVGDALEAMQIICGEAAPMALAGPKYANVFSISTEGRWEGDTLMVRSAELFQLLAVVHCF
jgi:hypothetical protein